jgi:hypothetical protein
MTEKTNIPLSLGERLVLLNIIPREGSYFDIKIIRKFLESLSVSETEYADCEFVEKKDGTIDWNKDKDPNKEIYFGRRMETIVRDTLIDLEKNEKLNVGHLSVYDKFVGAPDE